MKTLKLAFSRIFTYFSENKMIFILYLIGTITCVVMMIYYYGNTLTYKTGANNDDISFRLYSVDFIKPEEVTNETLEKLKSFEQSYGIQDIILYSVLDKNGNDTMEPKYTVDYDNNGNKSYTFEGDEKSPSYYLSSPDNIDDNVIILESYLHNNNNVMYNPKADIFTDKQLNQNVAIAPKGKSGSLKIQGQDFEIIRNESVSDYTIPIGKYFDSKVRTSKIEICVSERFSKNMMFRYGDFLNNLFAQLYPNNNISVTTPEAFYGIEDNGIQQEFALIIIVFIVSVISFMFLLKYLMDSNRRENSIFMMVGAKKKHILIINFLENIILTVFCTAVAITLHAIFYNSLFSKINIYDNITYSLQDYAIIALVSIGLSIIVQIPFIFTYWFKNIRKIKEESK